MIHSLSGGKICEQEYFNFAKAECFSGDNIGQIRWFILKNLTIKEKDVVCVGREQYKIVRIDKNVPKNLAPMAVKSMGVIN